jgi:hypothetical protein
VKTHDRRKLQNQRRHSRTLLRLRQQRVKVNDLIPFLPRPIVLILRNAQRQSAREEVAFETMFLRSGVAELDEEVDGGAVRDDLVLAVSWERSASRKKGKGGRGGNAQRRTETEGDELEEAERRVADEGFLRRREESVLRT